MCFCGQELERAYQHRLKLEAGHRAVRPLNSTIVSGRKEIPRGRAGLSKHDLEKCRRHPWATQEDSLSSDAEPEEVVWTGVNVARA